VEGTLTVGNDGVGRTITVNHDLNIASGGMIQPGTMDASHSMQLNGNWINNGTFDGVIGSRTISATFNKSGTALLKKGSTTSESTETFCNLTINTGTTLDTADDFVAASGSGNCGAFTQNGILRRQAPAQSVTNGGPTRTFQDSRNLDAILVTQTSGSNMGNTTATISSNQTPPACGSMTLSGSSVKRYYTITPNNTTNIQATLRLYYRTANPDESNGNALNNLAIYHCNGTTWQELTGSYTRNSDANGNYLELSGVSTFSPFALAGASPTAVTVSDFDAAARNASAVKVTWQTASELDVLGFNIWRSPSDDSGYQKLNTTLLAAQNPGSVNGAKYRYTDLQVQADKTYLYKLEALDTNGSAAWYGPVKVKLPTGCANKPTPPKLLSPARNAQVNKKKVEFVWGAATCASSYTLELREGSRSGPIVERANSLMTQRFKTRTLKPGANYHWHIRACNVKGCSKWSSWFRFTIKN
jgi:hypothetical protein